MSKSGFDTIRRGGNLRHVMLVAALASVLAHSRLPACAQATSSDEIAALERQAEADLKTQHADLAINKYKKILTLDSTNVGAHSNLGLAHYIRGDFASAVAEFHFVLRAKSDQWNLVALCGISEANIGQNGDALLHLNQAFQNVTDPALRMAVGKRLFSILFEKGDLDRAAQIVGELQQIDPKNIDVIYAAHQVYSAMDSRTIVTMEQLAPDSARVYQLRGDRMTQLGNGKAAIALYRAAIKHDAHLSGIHFELA